MEAVVNIDWNEVKGTKRILYTMVQFNVLETMEK